MKRQIPDKNVIQASPPGSISGAAYLYVILSFFLLLAPAQIRAESSEPIFILHSYSQEYSWTSAQHKGFVEKYLSVSSQQALISTEYLDTKRIVYQREYADFFADYLKKKYKNYHPGKIYVTDDNALKFAIEYLSEMFPNARVFFSGVNDYSVIDKLDRSRYTGVFEKKEIAPNIELLQLIEPGLNQIVVVGDGSSTYQAIKQEIKQELLTKPNISANYIEDNNVENLIVKLQQARQKYLFLTSIGGVTDNLLQQLSLKEIIHKITTAGDFVVISMEDAYLFDGVLGGYVTSGERQGEAAANLLLEFEQGRDIKQIPLITTSPNTYIFDYRELVKYKFKLTNEMLKKSIVLFKPASFYERYKWFILSVIYFLAVVLIVSMAVFISLLTRKNKKIQTASDEISMQAKALEEIRNTLTDAQKIAHLGNWEWRLDQQKCCWSEEVYRILGEEPNSVISSYDKLLSYVYADDKDAFKKSIDDALTGCQSYDLEHRIELKNGNIKYVRQTGNVHCNDKNKPVRLVGILLDISSMKNYEILEVQRLERIEKYQKALLEWSRATYKNIDDAFRRAAEISAQTLEVKRVSIWLYNADHSALECYGLYKLNLSYEKINKLEREVFPNYFKAVDAGNIMMITDARSDERSREFTDLYLKPNDIYSLMDVPILYQGEVTGVVCHEHTGEPRSWKIHELEFASAITNTVSLSLEIEKRKKIENELEHQAYHDVLTNLPNRSLFMDRLEQAIKLACRTETMMAVLFLDLDKFKEINDSLGHAVGDQVLIMVGKRIQECLREVDTISRLGGDEFSLIIGSIRDPQHINEIASKLFNELQKPMNFTGHEIYVTSSIGISIYPEDGETADTLLKNADAAMYKAKEEGRNSYQFYTEDMTERAFERVLMESNLRRALEREEFVVYYQPQYDATTDSLVGMEALVRWQHPEMGLVSPAKFIPIAEDAGLIVDIDRWVFTTAVTQLTAWYRQGLNPGKLALNLAMKQLHKEDFLEFIQQVIDRTECESQWLAFEVTEGQIMRKPEQAIAVLKKISDMGIEIAVDDFGTGYSSLTYLKRLPVNKLKIDQAFVHDVPDDDEDVAIVCAIIALAKSMKLSVIAEGVEKVEQKEFLLAQGCPLIQGYLYARPMPAEDIEKLLLSY